MSRSAVLTLCCSPRTRRPVPSSAGPRRLPVAVLAMAFVAIALPLRAAAAPPARAAWTVMVYEDADNSLETPELANVKEMLQVGSSAQVQVVMLCDRSPKSEPKDRYSSVAIGGLPDWSGAKLLHVEKGKLTPLATWGDTNMADPATLRRFLEAAAKQYPADRYGLIIADHGSGWMAFCVDESSGDKTMSLRDLRSGLEPFVKEHGKLELVGLDACLMGSFETAQALEPVAHYMVASEEVAPARGWNYDALLKSLADKPASNGFDLGRSVIDAYTIHFNESKDPLAKFESMGTTLSLIELDQFAALQSSMSALGDRCTDSLRKGRAGWAAVARSRARSEEYGIVGPRTGAGEEEMHDLMDIVQTLETSGDAAVTDAAKQVDLAIRKSVRYFMRGPCRPHAGGISVYFPTAGIELRDQTGSDYLRRTYAKDARWINFLSLYSVAIADLAAPPDLKPIKATGKTAAEDKPVTILSKTTDADIDKVHFVMLAHDGPDLLMIGRLPSFRTADGTMGQRFNGAWFHMSTRAAGVTCPVTAFESLDDKNERYLAYVPAMIRRAAAQDWTKVECVFYISVVGGAPVGKLLYAFAATPQGPLQVSLQKGDAIKPIYVRIKPDGGVSEWTSPDRGVLTIDDPSDFGLRQGLIGRGAYQLGFEVINYAGIPAMQLDEFILE
jgi:hypothetical protein